MLYSSRRKPSESLCDIAGSVKMNQAKMAGRQHYIRVVRSEVILCRRVAVAKRAAL